MEKLYTFNQSKEKLLEPKIVNEDVVVINHIILNKGDAVPTHNSDSNVFQIIVRGAITLRLEENTPKKYGHGSIISIPCGTKMGISNEGDEQLEFFVIKAPNPSKL